MKNQLLIFTAGSLFMAVISFFSIPIPWSPIPLSLQSLAVSTLSILFLSQAWYATLGYLILATLGFPVFAGGEINAEWFLSPKAGYYFGFLAASILVGIVLERVKPDKFWTSWLCLALNETTILFIGWLCLSLHLSPQKALFIGVLPFIPGALIKITIATLLWCKIYNGDSEPCKLEQ